MFWRPPQEIKVKVLGLAWRGDQLLLVEVEDDQGSVKGFRPLGGSVEFGEARETALRREFEEELGCTVVLNGPWHSFENIYWHEGAQGHEYIYLANVHLGNEALYEQDQIAFVEADLIACRAVWLSPGELPEGAGLFPDGLREFLERQDRTS